MLAIDFLLLKWQKFAIDRVQKNGATSNFLGHRPVISQGISAHGVLRNKNFKLSLDFLYKLFPCPVYILFFYLLGSLYHCRPPFHKPFQHLLQSPHRRNLQSLYTRHYPMEMPHLAVNRLSVVVRDIKQAVQETHQILRNVLRKFQSLAIDIQVAFPCHLHNIAI